MIAIATVFLLFASQALAQCISGGVTYSAGQTWTDEAKCEELLCKEDGSVSVKSACMPQEVNKKECYSTPGKGPFPKCCPRWTCLSDDGTAKKKIIDVPMQKVKWTHGQ